MLKSSASAQYNDSAISNAPKNGVYILVFDSIKGWVKAKWVEHAQMFSVEDPEYRCKFYPVKHPVAWQHLPNRPEANAGGKRSDEYERSTQKTKTLSDG